jgi:hypothetical protein
LEFVVGVSRTRLHHINGDAFIADADPESRGDSLDFIRDASGRIVAFMWDDDRYDRVAG